MTARVHLFGELPVPVSLTRGLCTLIILHVDRFIMTHVLISTSWVFTELRSNLHLLAITNIFPLSLIVVPYLIKTYGQRHEVIVVTQSGPTRSVQVAFG